MPGSLGSLPCFLAHSLGLTLGSIQVSGKLPIHPSPETNINAYFSLRAKCWLSGGVGGQFSRNLNIDPQGEGGVCIFLLFKKIRHPSPQSSSFAYYRSLFTMEHEKLPGHDKIRASCQANVSPAIYQMWLQTKF